MPNPSELERIARQKALDELVKETERLGLYDKAYIITEKNDKKRELEENK